MRLIILLLLSLTTAQRIPCSSNITYVEDECPEDLDNPSCAYIQNNIEDICDTAPDNAISDRCGIIKENNTCTYSQHLDPNTELQMCCELDCPPIGTIGAIPSECQDKPDLYNSFLDTQNSLTTSQASTIAANLNGRPPATITNILQQTGVLALNSLPPQTPFTTATSNFNLYAIQLPTNKAPPQINQPNLQVNFPPFSTANTSLSVIRWQTNPYKNITNASKPDTNVISIKLSNYSGSSITNFTLSQPVQMTWFINQTNQTNQTVSCMYWNTSLSNWDTYGCYLVNKTTTQITCNCTHLTDFAARFTSVIQSNNAIFISASSVYSIEGLRAYINFYIIFGSIATLGLLTFTIGHYLDNRDSKTYISLLLNNSIVNVLSKKYIIDVCESNESNESNESSESSETAHKTTLLYILWSRILFQHSQLGAFLKYDPRLSRVFRLMLIFVGLFNSLFLTAFMYGFTYGSALQPMTIVDSLLLSLVTAALNYPSIILLTKLVNSAGLAEFSWRYPILLDELVRRHKFENEICMYELSELDIDFNTLQYTQPEKIKYDFSSFSRAIQETFTGLIFFNQKTKYKEKGNLNKAYSYAKQPYQIVEPASKYLAVAPFHTYKGAAVFLIALTWFLWTINYLLLFSANHSPTVSNSILTSFGLNELETVFLVQPLTIMLVLVARYIARKVHKKSTHIPSLYYFSDPFVGESSTTFSTQFAFDIFVNIPSQISHTLDNKVSTQVKNLGYSSIESVLDYVESGPTKYTPTAKETKIESLYTAMANHKKNSDLKAYSLVAKKYLQSINDKNDKNNKL